MYHICREGRCRLREGAGIMYRAGRDCRCRSPAQFKRPQKAGWTPAAAIRSRKFLFLPQRAKPRHLAFGVFSKSIDRGARCCGSRTT